MLKRGRREWALARFHSRERRERRFTPARVLGKRSRRRRRRRDEQRVACAGRKLRFMFVAAMGAKMNTLSLSMERVGGLTIGQPTAATARRVAHRRSRLLRLLRERYSGANGSLAHV